MIRYRDSRVSGYTKNAGETSRIPTVQVLKSYGTINSTGVWPSGATPTGETTEVEFSLNIYRTGKAYQGEIYLVNYDTREKINSSKLTYFEQSNVAQIISIFSIDSPCNDCCGYDLIVAVSPTNCSTRCNGILYAYVPPIYNQGLNIGGPLITGEVNLCCQDCCTYDSSECTYYDTADNVNSCCSNRNISSNTAASVAVSNFNNTSTNGTTTSSNGTTANGNGTTTSSNGTTANGNGTTTSSNTRTSTANNTSTNNSYYNNSNSTANTSIAANISSRSNRSTSNRNSTNNGS